MRLTLRTLLAYMDDILDPADQDDLARQVEESEKATELIHRTRDATRRLRLGAPPVIGEGMELDPNCVAEYLDNTMPPDDMTEFQQVCLDSDVHLAEVASCHHILTMVLGEPAEIEPEMREHMYGVPGRVDEWRQLRLHGPHLATKTNDAPSEPARKSDSGVDEPITEVPDYLKANESSAVGRLALAFAAALVLGFGGFMLFGPGGILRDDAPMAQKEGVQQQPDQGHDTAPVNPTDTLGSDESATADQTDNSSQAIAGENVEPLDVDVPGAENTQPKDAGSDANQIDNSANDSAVAVAPESTSSNTATDDTSATETSTTPTDTDVTADDSATASTGDPDYGPGELLAMNTNDVADVMPDTVIASETAAKAEGTAEDFTPPEAAPLGTMVAIDQILLRWDPIAEQWLRMPSRSSIVAGDHLLSLPTYRPSLALASGLRVEFSDGANMTADYADDGVTPRLEAIYGRFLIQNTDMEPLEVELAVGDKTKRVMLEPTAVLGFELDRPFVAGADVENSVGMFDAKFYAPDGSVTWNVGVNPLPVITPSQWAWDDVTASSMTHDVSWLNGQSLDYLMQNVSRNFEAEFDSNRPARLQLLELYESSRRREEKALAAQCGTHVGQFVPLVQALADTQQQSSWDEHITELRQAMSRSTQAARSVHETLTEQRGAALADDLFEMLRGYSPEDVGTTRDQIASGVTRRLIDWLEHDRLEYRVLAIHNLKDIYGGKTLGYNPVVTEPSRQERAVRMWRTRLADNELVPTYLK